MSDQLIVLCNAGPLITLGKLNRLELFVDLYDDVQIPRRVYDEVVTQGLACGAPEALTVRLFWQRHGWPVVDVPSDVLSVYTPLVTLDPGETEVLALARTLKDPLVLLDDEVALAEARHDRMVELVERILALHKQLAAAKTDHDKTALQRQIDATDRQIDWLVYELYGLAEEEIKIVEEGT